VTSAHQTQNQHPSDRAGGACYKNTHHVTSCFGSTSTRQWCGPVNAALPGCLSAPTPGRPTLTTVLGGGRLAGDPAQSDQFEFGHNPI